MTEQEKHKLQEIKLPPLRQNRFKYNPAFKLSGSFGTEEFWEFNRKIRVKQGKKSLSLKQFVIITNRINKAIYKALILGNKYYPPCFSGFEIYIDVISTKIRLDKDTNKANVKNKVSYPFWNKDKKAIDICNLDFSEFINFDSRGERYKIGIKFRRNVDLLRRRKKHVNLYLHFKATHLFTREVKRRFYNNILFLDVTQEYADKLYDQYKRNTEQIE